MPSTLGRRRSSRTRIGSLPSLPARCASIYASASSPSRQTMIGFATPCSLNACSVRSRSIGLSSTSRIGRTRVFMSGHRRRRAGTGGQLQKERRSPRRVDDSARHHPAALVGHFLHDRQPRAGAFEVLLSHQPIEQPEDAVVILHIEADAVVGDGDPDAVERSARWRSGSAGGVGAAAVLEALSMRFATPEQAALPRVNTCRREVDSHLGALRGSHWPAILQNRLDHGGEVDVGRPMASRASRRE